jgi:hypothetical protein
MKIVCIAGSISNVGKTTFAERLLSRLPGWAACKVTVCAEGKDHRCPRGKNDCGVCASLEGNYLIEERDAVIRQEGKDTFRYSQAGASKVIWVKTRYEYLKESVERAQRKLASVPGIVFEGNHALEVIEPDVAVMLLSDPPRYKASATSVLHKIMLTGEASDSTLLEKTLELLKKTQ